jgi:methyl-accepting chemotaxis protein
MWPSFAESSRPRLDLGQWPPCAPAAVAELKFAPGATKSPREPIRVPPLQTLPGRAMNLNDMKIRTRLMLGFAVMAALIAVLGAAALYNLMKIHQEFGNVMDNRYPKLMIANDIKAVNNDVSQAIRNLFIVSDPDDIKAQFDLIAGSAKRTNENIDRLKNTITSAEGKAALDKLMEARADYRKPREKVIELLKAGRAEEAKNAVLLDLRPKQIAYMDRLEDLIKLQDKLMRDSGADVAGTVAETKLTIASLLALAFAAAFVLAWWIIRSTTRPIDAAVTIMRAVAAGDLYMQFKADGRNETGLLLGGLHAMQTRLAAVVGQVRGAAEGVASASVQIAQGNNDLSSRTEQQASALQQTAASMEQLNATVRQNADNARQANQLALGASTVAVQGGEAVAQVVDTMKGINASSKRIVDIISVIDGIAFQTNILALNAAVEAARAGEQGRGFAVVASEVRSLAQRSAEAAKEIKSLISASVERVEQGTVLVDKAGATMQEVVASIRRVTAIVGEISAASSEQSTGVAQVGEAITQMDEATQRNSALVEESAAAAESLKLQASQLVDAVAFFRLGSGSAIHGAPAPHAAGTATRAAAAAKPAAKPAAKTSSFQAPARSVATASPGKAIARSGPIERRGANRATNVVRPSFGVSPKPAEVTTVAFATAAGAGADEWESF